MGQSISLAYGSEKSAIREIAERCRAELALRRIRFLDQQPFRACSWSVLPRPPPQQPRDNTPHFDVALGSAQCGATLPFFQLCFRSIVIAPYFRVWIDHAQQATCIVAERKPLICLIDSLAVIINKQSLALCIPGSLRRCICQYINAELGTI